MTGSFDLTEVAGHRLETIGLGALNSSHDCPNRNAFLRERLILYKQTLIIYFINSVSDRIYYLVFRKLFKITCGREGGVVRNTQGV